MNTEYAASSREKKLLIEGIMSFVALGCVFAFVGTGTGWFISQVSGAPPARISDTAPVVKVTPLTTSNQWQPSANNPKRAAVAEYATLLDNFVRKILNKGSGMSKEAFSAYLTKLSAAIRAIAAKQEYANEKLVQDVLGYLAYEFNAIMAALAS